VKNGFTPCGARCCLDPANASRLRDPIDWNSPTPIGFADALGAAPPEGTTGADAIAHLAAPLLDMAAPPIRPLATRSRVKRIAA
jgi:hypothetical protein